MSPTPDPDWPEAMAEVTACTYRPRFGRALAFGLPSTKHFHIAYTYWIDDIPHTGELFAEKPIQQGSLFPIRYDPDQPQAAQPTASGAPNKVPLLAFGLAGSVIISFAWFLALRGCH